MARDLGTANNLKKALEDGGLLVKIKPVSRDSAVEDNCYEVLVPAAEVAEAHNIIIEIGF